jgi:hypothetical protein
MPDRRTRFYLVEPAANDLQSRLLSLASYDFRPRPGTQCTNQIWLKFPDFPKGH